MERDPFTHRSFDLTIVAGGQTGVDRAALDWAIEFSIPHSGWCPKGRLAEDGPIPTRYKLKETPRAEVEKRTEWNVRDSDGTVIFSLGKNLEGGSLFTESCANRLKRPCLKLSSDTFTVAEAATKLRAFIADNQIQILNIAGPRASEEPGVDRYVTAVLGAALGVMKA